MPERASGESLKDRRPSPGPRAGSTPGGNTANRPVTQTGPADHRPQFLQRSSGGAEHIRVYKREGAPGGALFQAGRLAVFGNMKVSLDAYSCPKTANTFLEYLSGSQILLKELRHLLLQRVGLSAQIL